LPIVESQLAPCAPVFNIRKYDKRHVTRTTLILIIMQALDPLDPGQSVWVTRRRESGVVMQPAETPRSYLVSTPTGCIKRNRQHLTTIPESCNDPDITV